MARARSCILQSLACAVLLVGLLGSLCWFLVHHEGLPRLLWVILLLGAWGGATESLRRNDGFVFCEFRSEAPESGPLWKLGTLGDVVIGVGGAFALAFLFGGTILKVDFDRPTYLGLLILTSVSFAAGLAGRPLVDAAAQALAGRVAKKADLATQRSEQALRRSERAEAPGYVVMARVFRKENLLEAASRVADEALRAGPDNAEAHLEKARILKLLALREEPADAQKLQQAVDHAARACEISPAEEVAWYNLACYEARLGRDRKRALGALQRAIALLPANRGVAWADRDLASLWDAPEFVTIAGARPQG